MMTVVDEIMIVAANSDHKTHFPVWNICISAGNLQISDKQELQVTGVESMRLGKVQQQQKGPSEIDISSKSMSLAEGVVLRGIREMKSNSTGFIRALNRLSSSPTKNPSKSWENLIKITLKHFDFVARITPKQNALFGHRRISRNKLNKDLNQMGMCFFFEKISPKLVRVWLSKPHINKSTKQLQPDFHPICNLSHHALSRIFYREKSVTSFNGIIRESMCPEFLHNLTVLALSRVSKLTPPKQLDKYIELAIDFADLNLGSPAGCVETNNGIFLLREPDSDHIEKPAPNTFSAIFHSAIKNKTVLVVSTWVPKAMVKKNQLDFISSTLDFI